MTDISNILKTSELVAGRLKLLANVNRLRIACRLLKGETSVGDIETELDIRQPTLSREIANLRDGGVITARRQSKVVFYSLTDPDMRQLIEAICHASAGGNANVSPKSIAQPNARAKQINFNPRPKFNASRRGNPPPEAAQKNT